MTSNTYANEAIEDVYNSLLKKIRNGIIYGVPVDLDNPKHVAVALYFAGGIDGKNDSNRYLTAIKKLGI